MQYRTRGIIIKRKNFGEADRLLTIYTEKRGKITAIARGSRRVLSKLAGHLELFYLSDLIFVEGKNIDTITGAQIIEVFPILRKNLIKTNRAHYLAELIDQLIKENEPSREIFNLLKQALRYLDRFGRGDLLLPYFELRLLSLLGHKPEVGVCVKCRKKLEPQVNYFSHSLGGILGSDCHRYDLSSSEISPGTIKLIRLLLNQDLLTLNKLKRDSRLEKELDQILDRFIQRIAEKELKTKRFLEGGMRSGKRD